MANITSYLRGSRLVSQRISKDRYTLRNAPQWLGPQLADFVSCASANYNWAPLNGSNPLIDVDGRIHHGANFQVMVLKSVMDKTILTLPTLGFLLFPQCTELISGRFENGLPLNLCTDIHKSPNYLGSGSTSIYAYVSNHIEITLCRGFSEPIVFQINESGFNSVNCHKSKPHKYMNG